MPLYEYQCTQCAHSFEKLQSMSSTGADCPNCEQPAKRSLSVFAAVSKGSSNGTDFAPMPPMGGMGGGGCCGGGCCGPSH